MDSKPGTSGVRTSPRRGSGTSPRRGSGTSPRRGSGTSPRRGSGTSPRRGGASPARRTSPRIAPVGSIEVQGRRASARFRNRASPGEVVSPRRRRRRTFQDLIPELFSRVPTPPRQYGEVLIHGLGGRAMLSDVFYLPAGDRAPLGENRYRS